MKFSKRSELFSKVLTFNSSFLCFILLAKYLLLISFYIITISGYAQELKSVALPLPPKKYALHKYANSFYKKRDIKIFMIH